MSNESKISVSQDEMAGQHANTSEEQVVEAGGKAHHNYLKSRHLYMIAMGGKGYST